MNGKVIVAIVAAAVVAIGAIVFAVSRDGHMDDGVAHGAHMGDGPAWDGAMMDMGGMPGMSMGSGGRMHMDEQAFLPMMVAHHEMAVEMARIELARGEDAAAKALARRVIADQTAEVELMRGWYREWFGDELPSIPLSGAVGMMGMGMDMDDLRDSPEPDRTFLRMMIPHHAGALLMADMALNGEPRDEVRDLARRIVAAQSLEIAELQEERARIAPPLG